LELAELTPNFGGYGLVGVIKNGDRTTLMIRTDLDGLPVTEETGLEYASRVRVKDDLGKEVGVMHACGHDIHMTCFVGTARLLSQMKNSWKGTLVMIGQPAEERGGGALAMLSASIKSSHAQITPWRCMIMPVLQPERLGFGKATSWRAPNRLI